MPSFDVVSQVELQEVRNAVDQTQREIGTRYDFKGSRSEVTQKEDALIEIIADDRMRLEAIQAILKQRMAKRGVSIKLLEFKDPQAAASNTLRQEVLIKQGLSSEELKKLVKIVKESGFKVQTQIQGDQLRVSGKKRDDLQAAIAALRAGATELELQFVNFRD